MDDVSCLEHDVRVVIVVDVVDGTYEPDDHDVACCDFAGRGPHLRPKKAIGSEMRSQIRGQTVGAKHAE